MLGYLFNQSASVMTPSTYGNQAAADYNAQGGGALGLLGVANRYNPTLPFYNVFSGIDAIQGNDLSGMQLAQNGLTAFGSALLVGSSFAATAATTFVDAPPVLSTTTEASPGTILGPQGANQFILYSDLGSQSSATVIRDGEFVNRLFDSSYPADGVSGPVGSSLSPGSGVPSTADVGIADRGLNLFYPNNAQQAIIYQATANIPATLRTSIGGTAPELIISPEYFPSLQPVVEFPVIPTDTRPWSVTPSPTPVSSH
jgi:hypothetical protein